MRVIDCTTSHFIFNHSTKCLLLIPRQLKESPKLPLTPADSLSCRIVILKRRKFTRVLKLSTPSHWKIEPFSINKSCAVPLMSMRIKPPREEILRKSFSPSYNATNHNPTINSVTQSNNFGWHNQRPLPLPKQSNTTFSTKIFIPSRDASSPFHGLSTHNGTRAEGLRSCHEASNVTHY